ncbi:MAG: hypothetical protein WCA84_18375 [Ignavibacteriaceae bacterium]
MLVAKLHASSCRAAECLLKIPCQTIILNRRAVTWCLEAAEQRYACRKALS